MKCFSNSQDFLFFQAEQCKIFGFFIFANSLLLNVNKNAILPIQKSNQSNKIIDF